ncbi:mast cell protease 3-like [Terrapene carolina triunguis]|uniref:mast cell protease 3-like n=1 Tax=Terrapene triunguis TaxID=2587831 RepID=UPI000CEF6BFC|nr:mast cell protease 3-like [Terrapene carolina triunguis]
MLLLLLFPMAFFLPPGAQAGEIIGGQEARPHSRPYMAFVKIEREGKGGSMCGGFLIQDDVVVTAAHCNCNLGNISVLLGAHNFAIDELGRQKIWVRRRIPHPEFNDETFENDIMLLQLRNKAKMTQTVGTISLSQETVKKGTVCSVAGWGQTSMKTNAQPSPTLQEVELMVMGKCMCLSRPYLHYVPSRMLCVGDPQERKAPFLGDSGGPLVCDGKATGIVSHGTGDGSTPSVFTKLSKYVCWIKKTLRKLKP